MKIYVVHTDLLEDGTNFDNLTDEQVEELYCKDDLLVNLFNSWDEFVANWNQGTIFDPDFSYIRVIE